VKGAKSPHESLYFYYRDNQLQAVMSGDWKLYLPHDYISLGGRPGGRDGVPAEYEWRTILEPELYNLRDDAAEQRDVAARHPEEMTKLLAIVEQARADLGDTLTNRFGPGLREPGFLVEPRER